LRKTLDRTRGNTSGKKGKVSDVSDKATSSGTAVYSAEFGSGLEKLSSLAEEKADLLSKRMKACTDCPHGSDSYCAKTVQGSHVRMTTTHIKSWAKAWVCVLCVFLSVDTEYYYQAAGTIGVSLELPPNTPLFTFFYTAPANSMVSPPQTTQALAPAATPTPVPVLSPALPTMTSPAGMPDMNTMMTLTLMQVAQSQLHLFERLGAPNPQLGMILAGPSTSGAVAIKPNINYPKFDQFFEDLSQECLDRDTGSILACLTDARIYRISELVAFTDTELTDIGLKPGDVKWLRRIVQRAIQVLSI